MFVLVHLVNFILQDFLNGIEFIFKIPITIIIFAILFSGITIYVSSILVARKAAKVSPIEAIRNSGEIKIKRNKMKSPKIIKKIFSIGGDIAYKNLKRNKTKYRTTVISLVVSIVTFISLSSFIYYGFKVSNVYYTNLSYNVVINIRNNNDKENYEILKEISKMNNVEKHSIKRSTYLKFETDKYLSEQQKDIEKQYETYNPEHTITILAIGEDAYNDFIKKLGGNSEKYKKGGILIDEMIFSNENERKESRIYNLKEGDYLKGNLYSKENEIGEELSIEIVKRTTERPMGLENVYSSNGYLIVSDEFIKKIGYRDADSIDVYSKNPNEFENELEELKKTNTRYSGISVYNLDESVRANNAMVLVISIFLYGFITVITLIGVTNIFNTITTNMNLRSKEFAMLKSIGMTKKEFNRMIRLESLFYGMKSLIIGIPIGTVLSYFICQMFKSNLEMNFIIPWDSILIASIFVFAVIGIIMKYSLTKINKQNIIETIRNENI